MTPIPPMAIIETKAVGWGLRILIAGLSLALAAGLGYGYRARLGDQALAAEKAVEHAAEIKRLSDTAARDAATSEREKEHANEVGALRARYAELQSTASAVAADRDRALRSGALRVRVPVAGGCLSEAVPAGPSASGADGRATAELDPAFAAALERITDDGDAGLRQLAALQEWAADASRVCRGAEVKP